LIKKLNALGFNYIKISKIENFNHYIIYIMKISLVSHNLSSNALGRAYVLHELLSDSYETEIVGPILWDGIWEPLRFDKNIKIKTLEKGKNINKQLGELNTDVLYAIKPTFTGYRRLGVRNASR